MLEAQIPRGQGLPILKADLLLVPSVRENSIRWNGVVRYEKLDFTTGRVEQPHVGDTSTVRPFVLTSLLFCRQGFAYFHLSLLQVLRLGIPTQLMQGISI